MKPIGLTIKQGRNKYQREPRGELMLVHECTDCKTFSINRIAADDDSEAVMAVFEESLGMDAQMHSLCFQYGIMILKSEERKMVHTQLYGHAAEPVGWR
jgi:hypothetical protein